MDNLLPISTIKKPWLNQNYCIGFAKCKDCEKFCIFVNEKQSDGSYKCYVCQGKGYKCKNYSNCKNFYNKDYILNLKLKDQVNLFATGINNISIPISNFYCEDCQPDICYNCKIDIRDKSLGNIEKIGDFGYKNVLCKKCNLKILGDDNVEKKCYKNLYFEKYEKYIIKNIRQNVYNEYCELCYKDYINKNNIFYKKELIHIRDIKDRIYICEKLILYNNNHNDNYKK